MNRWIVLVTAYDTFSVVSLFFFLDDDDDNDDDDHIGVFVSIFGNIRLLLLRSSFVVFLVFLG